MALSEDRHIEKVKKLLALSKSANVHEAALAMEHAQRLMAEHSLTMQDVRASDVKSHTGPMAKAKNPAAHIQWLAKMVADSFGCEVILSSREVDWGKWETSACFIGIQSAAGLAGYAFDVLRRQLDRDRREHILTLARCKAATKTRRADAFCMAWVSTAHSKVVKLILPREYEEAIEAYKKKVYPDITEGKTRKSKGLRPGDFSSVASGVAKGKDAYLHAGVATTQRKQIS